MTEEEGVIVGFGTGIYYELEALLRDYPHLELLGTHYGDYINLRYEGAALQWLCFDEGAYAVEEESNDIIPFPNCLARHKERCGKDYLPNILPGMPGCLGKQYGGPSGIGLQALSRYSGSFTIPEGARSFQFALTAGRQFRLTDPNGKEHSQLDQTQDELRDEISQLNSERRRLLVDAGAVHPDGYPKLEVLNDEHWRELDALNAASLEASRKLAEAEREPSVTIRGGGLYTLAMTEITSDLSYSHEDVAVPGEWRFEVLGKSAPAYSVLVVKTRNDDDDKLRLKVVNATLRTNEEFGPGMRLWEKMAAHYGINLEIASIHRMEHLDNPHNTDETFCERFCSADEAVVLFAEPGGWSSPGPGVALNIDYYTHFLVGAEVVTEDCKDYYLGGAMHELLHHVGNLGHIFEWPGGFKHPVPVDSFEATAEGGGVVGPDVDIAGGLNYQRLWAAGKLNWLANIMVSQQIFPDEGLTENVDGFGCVTPDGKPETSVAFIERHQLENLKNHPLYW